MTNVTGVRFRPASKIYYFAPNEIKTTENQGVIVETARGLEFGLVAIPEKMVNKGDIVSPLRKIIRIATEEDLKQVESNKQKEKEAFIICNEKIDKHKLEMKLVDIQYAFDTSKIVFFFTADGRVDFRELVKDLASVFRTRIELRQIGVRDEAKMHGGIGPCGRELCCSTYLSEFVPVSIKMAKTQNLTLNPTKISGICGRLMCCLRYENEYYKEMALIMPKQGDRVTTVDGQGIVIASNVIKKSVLVELLDEKHRKEYGIDELEK